MPKDGPPYTSDRDLWERDSVGIEPEEQEAAVPTTDGGLGRPTLDAADLAGKPDELATERVSSGQDALNEELAGWRDRAMRLQAGMDNYRKRQQRLAQDQIEAERQRLLGAFLQVVDDLERALAVPEVPGNGLRDSDGVRRGVELTHRTAMQLLQREGVEPLEARHRPFDPNWHDAVATVGRNGSHVAANTVVEVVEPGYRLGERLLRPAKVVVAV
jgi:molecular chaperone GrpE